VYRLTVVLLSGILGVTACGGKSIAAADDAIRTLDDVIRAADSTFDDGARITGTQVDKIALQQPTMLENFQARLASVASQVGTNFEDVADVTCAVLDYVVEYGEVPEQSSIEDYSVDAFSLDVLAADEMSGQILSNVLNLKETSTGVEFAAVVQGACYLEF
jgi:hypothetical protein